VSDVAGEEVYLLRTTSTVRRALSETLPGAVAAAAYEFITRRGTYRIIYRIDDKNRIVTVVDVDHRRDI
jgi:mRNA interferase RelE/StbE